VFECIGPCRGQWAEEAVTTGPEDAPANLSLSVAVGDDWPVKGSGDALEVMVGEMRVERREDDDDDGGTVAGEDEL
jgi:hypothetical protein